ncbi:MAG: LPXTG cell wall anchor domain-containing protein [Mycetocola sp.]
MNNDQGYCGFADWPPCTGDLASTGVDPLLLVIVAGVLLVVGAVVLIIRGRR